MDKSIDDVEDQYFEEEKNLKNLTGLELAQLKIKIEAEIPKIKFETVVFEGHHIAKRIKLYQNEKNKRIADIRSRVRRVNQEINHRKESYQKTIAVIFVSVAKEMLDEDLFIEILETAKDKYHDKKAIAKFINRSE